MGKKDRGLNPADKQRKLDRQRELKRNKKQKSTTRQEQVKGRDSDEILTKLRTLDDQELDICNDSPAKAMIPAKRNKLLNNLKEMINVYRKEKVEWKARQLESQYRVYAEERAAREENFEAIKHAAMVNPNSIPMPSEPNEDVNAACTPIEAILHRRIPKIPLPESMVKVTPPGPPFSMVQEMSASEDEEYGNRNVHRRKRMRIKSQVEEVNVEPVEVPAHVFSGQQAMGLPIPPMWAPPPPPIPPVLGSGYSMTPFNYGATSIAADPELNRVEATISAEPQIRDMLKEVTRFVPLSVLKNKGPAKPVVPVVKHPASWKSTDEAYEEFMKQIDGM